MQEGPIAERPILPVQERPGFAHPPQLLLAHFEVAHSPPITTRHVSEGLICAVSGA